MTTVKKAPAPAPAPAPANLIEVGSALFTGVLTSVEKALVTDMATQAGKLANTRRKLAETMASNGWTGWLFKKDYIATCDKDEAGRLNEAATFIKGSIAKGLLSKDELSLWLMDSKAANKAGLQVERNKITSDINSYFSSFRTMLDNAYFALHPEVMEKINADVKAVQEKAGDDLVDEKSGLESAPNAKTLTLETLHRFVIDLTLEISASNDKQISIKRPMLIHALNMLEAACL